MNAKSSPSLGIFSEVEKTEEDYTTSKHPLSKRRANTSKVIGFVRKFC